MLQRLLKFKLISDYINYLCLVEPLLRDELYLQLASQTWQNPRLKSQENCWKLMLDCLACFDPLDARLTKQLLRYAKGWCAGACSRRASARRPSREGPARGDSRWPARSTQRQPPASASSP